MQQGAPGSYGRTEIVTDDGGDALMPQRCEQGEDVAHQAAQTKRGQVAVIVTIPARRDTVTAQIGCDHVIAARRDQRHQLAPAEGQFGEPMQ